MQNLTPPAFGPSRVFFTLRLADPESDLLIRRIGNPEGCGVEPRSKAHHNGSQTDKAVEACHQFRHRRAITKRASHRIG